MRYGAETSKARMPRTCALASPPTKYFTSASHALSCIIALIISTLAWAPVASIVLSCVFRCRHRTQCPRSVAVLSSRAMHPASFWWALCHGSDYKEELSFALRNVALVLEVIGCAGTVENGDARPMEKTASGCSTSRLHWRRCVFLSYNPTSI